MSKKMSLCRPCMELEKAKGTKLRVVKKGVDQKVMCVMCRRRRYGTVYEVDDQGERG